MLEQAFGRTLNQRAVGSTPYTAPCIQNTSESCYNHPPPVNSLGMTEPFSPNRLNGESDQIPVLWTSDRDGLKQATQHYKKVCMRCDGEVPTPSQPCPIEETHGTDCRV